MTHEGTTQAPVPQNDDRLRRVDELVGGDSDLARVVAEFREAWEQAVTVPQFDWLGGVATRLSVIGAPELVAAVIDEVGPTLVDDGENRVYRANTFYELATNTQGHSAVITAVARALRGVYEQGHNSYFMPFADTLLRSIPPGTEAYGVAGVQLVGWFGEAALHHAHRNPEKYMAFMIEYKSFWQATQLGPAELMRPAVNEQLGRFMRLYQEDKGDPYYASRDVLLTMGDPRFWQWADTQTVVQGLVVLQEKVGKIRPLTKEKTERCIEAIEMVKNLPEAVTAVDEVQRVVAQCLEAWNAHVVVLR